MEGNQPNIWKFRLSWLNLDSFSRKLFLAFGTIMTAAACDHDAFDGGLADQARSAFSSINPVLQLKEAFLSGRVNIIGILEPPRRMACCRTLRSARCSPFNSTRVSEAALRRGRMAARNSASSA